MPLTPSTRRQNKHSYPQALHTHSVYLPVILAGFLYSPPTLSMILPIAISPHPAGSYPRVPIRPFLARLKVRSTRRSRRAWIALQCHAPAIANVGTACAIRGLVDDSDTSLPGFLPPIAESFALSRNRSPSLLAFPGLTLTLVSLHGVRTFTNPPCPRNSKPVVRLA